MAMALPIAMFAGSMIKSYMDDQSAKSQDDQMRQAAAAKLAAMRQGAQQMESYRQGLTPQMLTAMNNRMQAYTPAQNVLSQMYGGHPTPPMGQMPTQPGAGSFGGMAGRPLIGQMQPPGPAINPGTPGGARAGANPYFGQQQVPSMGFGGEMPMPIDALRRGR